MLKSPVNSLIVTIDTKYIADLSNMIKRANLNPQTQINPADYVQLIGSIVSFPRTIIERNDYEGFSCKDIRVGDKAIFSHNVVFSFTEQVGGTATYKNMFWFRGQEYWKVDIQQLYAVIRNEQIIMVNGYCMVEEMSEPSQIVVPAKMKKILRTSTATLTGIGNPLEGQERISAERGDIVHYNPNKVITYQIKGKKFGILKQNQICAVEVGKYFGG